MHYTAGIGIILSEHEAADTIAENGGDSYTLLTLAFAPGTRRMGMGFVYGYRFNGVVVVRPGQEDCDFLSASLDHNRRQDA